MVQSPRLSRSAVAAWYDSQAYQASRRRDEGPYLDYLAEEDRRRTEARGRYAADLAPLLGAGARVLEVGCATGSLLAVLRAAGHEVVGVELSASFARSAKLLNDLDLVQSDFVDYAAADRSFDLVIMLGTISNLPDLGRHLTKVARILKRGGTFYFNVPIVDSNPARLFGSRYWMFAPSVCNFLSLEGVRAALRIAGFGTVDVATDRQRPTLAKLAGHLRLHAFYPALARLGLGMRQSPLALPIPGVKVVRARPA